MKSTFLRFNSRFYYLKRWFHETFWAWSIIKASYTYVHHSYDLNRADFTENKYVDSRNFCMKKREILSYRKHFVWNLLFSNFFKKTKSLLSQTFVKNIWFYLILAIIHLESIDFEFHLNWLGIINLHNRISFTFVHMDLSICALQP